MSAPKFTRHASVTRALLILIISFILIVCIQIFRIHGERISGELLKDLIAGKTDGTYQIDFEKIEISIWRNELLISELRLSPKPNLADSLKLTFEIVVPKLDLHLRSLIDVYTDKILSFESISIQDPHININRISSDSTRNTFSLETGELYHIIDKYLVEFSIDSLDLKKANITYSSKVHQPPLSFLFNSLDLQISNFLLDSTSFKKIRLLGTENIFIKLTNQQFDLADNIHSVNIDELIVSTLNQSAEIKNLTVKEKADNHQSNKSANKYQIIVPNLKFQGIDFAKAYLKNELTLESVTIYQPHIQITKSTGFTGSFEDNRITKMFRSVFDQVNVKKLHLDDANISAHIQLKGHQQLLNSNHISLVIEDFTIDSTNYLSDSPDQFFKHLSIDALKHEFMLSDSSHLVAFTEFKCSSKDSLLVINNLTITPISSRHQSKYNIAIPEVKLEGLEVHEFIANGNLKARLLTSSNGKYGLTIIPTKSKSNFDGEVSLEKVNLSNNEIAINASAGTLNLSSLDLKLLNLKLDFEDGKIQTAKYFADLIAASTANFQTEGQKITTGPLRASKHFRNFKIQNISEFNIFDKTNFTCQDFSLFGFKPDLLEQHQMIQFDSAAFIRPNIDLHLALQRKNQWLQKTSFKKLSIHQGNLKISKDTLFQLNSQGIEGTIKEFQFDSLSHLYSITSNFKVDSIFYTLPDQYIQAQVIGLIHYDSSQHSAIDHLSFHLGNQASTSFVGDHLDFSDLDLSKILNTGKLEFSHGNLQYGSFDSNANNQGNNLSEIPVKFQSFIAQTLSFNINQQDLQLSSPNAFVSLASFDTNLMDPAFKISYCIDSLKMQLKSDNIIIKSLEGTTANKSHHLIGAEIHSPDISLKADSIFILGIDPLQILNDKKIALNQLSVYHPIVNYHKPDGNSKTRIPLSLDIRNFSISNAQINMNEFNIPNISMSCGRMNIPYSEDELSLDNFDQLKIWGERIKFPIDGNLFSGSIGSYQFNFTERTAVLKKVRLIPKYNRGEFQNHITEQKDWFDGLIQEVSFSGLDFEQLINKKRLSVSHLTIKELDLDTHRDKRLPPEANKYKPLIQSSLRSVPYLFKIDTISIKSSFISHSEFSEKGELPGSIYFRNLNGEIRNITNDSAQIAKNPNATFKAKGALMNTGDFMITVRFDLSSKNDAFRFTGSLGKMDLTELNKFLQPTAYVLVKSGMCNIAEFTFEGNNDYAMGEMKFLYDDLKISVLNQQTYDTKGLGVSMKSFFANTFVVNTQNPHLFIERDGDIFHERNTEKSIFNFWGKALLSGVVSSIGATNNKKEIRHKNEEIRKNLED